MTGSDAFAADRRLGAVFGPWLGGVLTAMVALVRRTAMVPTVPQAA
ncbi:hypothetical protein MUY14_18925 [Amycolatopsis sp. FBCC-B4732]|nr:hypothetical protein [Amycolatopsis sp. FBCC-B4732]UOX92592.1 hypothetical protein MUY14_18925 [Amycolatopsis sp. FBCC-B4732]